MTNKSVIIKKVENGPDEVEVKPDLCTYYRAIVENIPLDGDDKFRLYLDVLAWGSFYIEAAMNMALTMVVEDSVHGILSPEDVTNPLERLAVDKKAILLLDKLCVDEEQRTKFKSSIRNLFSLRNRLVHPKEKPEKTNLTISATKEIENVVDAAKEMDSTLEDLMYSMDLQERKQQILEVGGWLENSIFEFYKR